MPHVLVLVHREGAFEESRYFLRAIADRWRASGIDVSVVRGPVTPRPRADVVVSHVDMTVVPRDHRRFLRRYPVVINGRVPDISKRRVSDQRLAPWSRWRGPVIVKTNANYGGEKEAAWIAAHGSRLQRALLAWREERDWPWRSRIPTAKYRVLDSLRDVPAPVWCNRALVVERFLPERHPDGFGLRTWIFLGDRETHSLSISTEPVVKSRNVVRRESLGEVPAELRARRAALGFDFGKFDYALVDGRVVLYDVNRTPSLGRFDDEEVRPRIEHLAAGLEAFL